MILDTDFSSDWDDVMDVKSALMLDDAGAIDLLGVTVCTSNQWAPGAIEAMRVHYGCEQFAIGTTSRTFDPGSGPGAYTEYFFDNYPHPLVGLADTVPDAVSETRRLLAARTSADVVLVGTGTMNNLADLLNSVADEHSPLSGSDLIEASVARLVYVGGRWPNSAAAEWNLLQDPVSANDVFANWPGLIEIVGVELGDTVVMGGAALDARPAADPVRKARDLWNTAHADSGGREGWGVLAFSWLMEPSWYRWVQGTGTVNAGTGMNTFAANAAGPHRYMVLVEDVANYATRGDAWISAQQDASS